MTVRMSRNIAVILKVRINSTELVEVLSEILSFVAKPRPERRVVFTPNSEFLVAANGDETFRQLLNQSDLNVADGFGLIWLSKFLGQPLPERISGADLVAKLLSIGNKEKWAVGIAGARRGEESEAEELIKRLEIRYPGLTAVNLDKPKLEIRDLRFEMVLACQGMGKQERWIMKNRGKIKAAVFLGIGGGLDFLTGFTERAPAKMRQLGLEWLWRGLQRPGHWKRVWNAVVVFPFLVLKEKVVSR
ncbi:MAG TPA: WecB/TagA/CpsF family glycosyltransferase [Patescibacteria group bacterium]|nr:WecB/TagA/CpsF family glycosyltransferase [Patescibacteria group bacterium]